MKRFVLVLSILLIFMMLASCDNEPYEDGIFTPESNETPELPTDFQNTFSAQLDGNPFIEETIYTTTSIDTNNANFMAITATKTAYHSIIIYLPLDIAAGTYHYSAESILTVPNLNVTYSNLEDVLQSGVGDGEIVIESHNLETHHIKGSFACVINSQDGSVHQITDGRFDIIY